MIPPIKILENVGFKGFYTEGVSKTYNSSLSHSATPFVLVEKTTPTPVIGLLRYRK
jgi:hypothetical protein